MHDSFWYFVTFPELLSLLGLLNHACKAVREGQAFLHRLINVSTRAKQLDHFIWLNQEVRSDIEWWHQFAEPWNEFPCCHH